MIEISCQGEKKSEREKGWELLLNGKGGIGGGGAAAIAKPGSKIGFFEAERNWDGIGSFSLNRQKAQFFILSVGHTVFKVFSMYNVAKHWRGRS